MTAEERFRERILAEAAGSGVPLGAYADAESLHYLFLREASGPFVLSHRLAANRAAWAISGTWPAFSWDEREMAQERGVRFDGLPDARPLRAQGGILPEAVVAHGEGLMHFVVGPVHAGIIEPGRFTFSSGGAAVVHLDAQLGYAHRGVERALEGRPALSIAQQVARICGSCSAARSLAYARALEMLSGVEVSAPVDLARLIVAELERVYNHLGDLAATASGAGWATGFAHGMALKEEAMRLNWIAAEHRLLFDAILPGGVSASTLAERRAVRAGLGLLEARPNATCASCSGTRRSSRVGTARASFRVTRRGFPAASARLTARRTAPSTYVPLPRTPRIAPSHCAPPAPQAVTSSHVAKSNVLS